MGVRLALRTGLKEIGMLDFTLGGVAVLIIVVYLVYALMRPENF